MAVLQQKEDASFVLASGVLLAQNHNTSNENYNRFSSSEFAISSKRVRQLADIPRAAGLRDVTVQVSIAHTKSKLRSRFFVEMKRNKSMPRQNWGFGVALLDVRKFEMRMHQLVKKHYRSNCQGERNGVKKCCAMCIRLKDDMRAWSAVKHWSAINPAHKQRKCDTIKLFFEKLFQLLSEHAHWLHECEALHEILRATEVLTQMQYPHDGDAVDVIRSLRRIGINGDEQAHPESDCTICISEINSEESSDTGRSCGVQLPCGHRFHDTCICMWLHARVDCPVCRCHVSASYTALGSSR